MSTLYVSDLDGTLFNSQKQVSPYTARVLSACIDKGMRFAVATARMPYGCDYRLTGIRMNTPGVLTNGVFLYQFDRKKILAVDSMTHAAARAVLGAFARRGRSCFLYTCRDDAINLYYGEKSLEEQTQYYSDRALKACGEVRLVEDPESALATGDPVYITRTGTEEELAPLVQEVGEIPGVAFAYYLNIYNGLYCIEVFSATASKKNALQKLMQLECADQLVVFGDNLNDLSMIEIADRSYAPANALDQVKERVTGVLESCDNDGVAKFLAEEFGV